MASPPERMILVGRVAGGFGVRGEVRISAFTEDPLSLKAWRDLKREDGSHAVTLLSARPAKGGIVGRLKEVETKEQADAMRGLKLYVPRAALPEPDEDEFYFTDLVGLSVRDADGTKLGFIKSVQDFGAGDILEIDPGQGRATWYLPFTRENVPDVRIADGYVSVVQPAEVSERDA